VPLAQLAHPSKNARRLFTFHLASATFQYVAGEINKISVCIVAVLISCFDGERLEINQPFLGQKLALKSNAERNVDFLKS
jgi:hypothetical protein